MKDSYHIENKDEYKNLKVNDGITQPSAIDNNAVSRFKNKKKQQLSVDDYFTGIRNGNRNILSRSITLIESSLPKHQELAQKIIEKCLPFSGSSIRIGITGVPGVGKSTFIETIGLHTIKQGKKLAVLAIDPSSERTQGSILGDKTRMEDLSKEPNAYIRPSPAAGSLGGVARKTRETIILCEAAGFDTIFIETVGVGQSETAVHSMVDFFLLLMLAGAGDELQGIKRGIMEMADLIAINKSDGDNIQRAKLAKQEYKNALHLFPLGESGWSPDVINCSAIKRTGINEIWQVINTYTNFTKENNYFSKRRNEQAKYWMYESIDESLKNNFYNNKSISETIKHYEQQILKNKISSFEAARLLLEEYSRR